MRFMMAKLRALMHLNVRHILMPSSGLAHPPIHSDMISTPHDPHINSNLNAEGSKQNYLTESSQALFWLLHNTALLESRRHFSHVTVLQFDMHSIWWFHMVNWSAQENVFLDGPQFDMDIILVISNGRTDRDDERGEW